MGTQSVNRREERGVSGRGLRGSLLREVDGQPQLVAAVDRERLLLRPDHARDLKGPATAGVRDPCEDVRRNTIGCRK